MGCRLAYEGDSGGTFETSACQWKVGEKLGASEYEHGAINIVTSDQWLSNVRGWQTQEAGQSAR